MKIHSLVSKTCTVLQYRKKTPLCGAAFTQTTCQNSNCLLYGSQTSVLNALNLRSENQVALSWILMWVPKTKAARGDARGLSCLPIIMPGGGMSSWFSQCDNQASRDLPKLILANLASYQCWWGCSSTSGVQGAGAGRAPVGAQCPHSDSQACPCELDLKARCCKGSKCLDCTRLVNLQWLLLQMTWSFTDITQA